MPASHRGGTTRAPRSAVAFSLLHESATMSKMRQLWSDPGFLAIIRTGRAALPASRHPAKPQLEKAPEVWHGTRSILDGSIKQLKQAIRDQFAGEGPELLAGIEKTVAKLDVILDKLDHRLAESLAKAHSVQDPTARQAELKNSKTIVADYIRYVKSEPLIAHIDANPLGIKTDLKKVLTDSLKHMALAIG